MEERIAQLMGVEPSKLGLRFSGRVAIAEMAAYASDHTDRSRCLLPRYLCNVVALAAKEAGLECDYFDVDDDFMPSRTEISAALAERKHAIVVLAPLYGSDGGLSWLEDTGFRRELKDSGSVLCIDLCQDLERVAASQRYVDEATFVVTSFNWKRIPGLMGAAVVAPGALVDSSKLKRLSQQEVVNLFKRACIQFAAQPIKRAVFGARPPIVEDLDYSPCDVFPFQFENFLPSRLQLGFAVAGLERMGEYSRRQRQLIQEQKPHLKDLPYAGSSPYVLLVSDVEVARRRRASYADAEDPTKSSFPNLKIVSNRGFADT